MFAKKSSHKGRKLISANEPEWGGKKKLLLELLLVPNAAIGCIAEPWTRLLFSSQLDWLRLQPENEKKRTKKQRVLLQWAPEILPRPSKHSPWCSRCLTENTNASLGFFFFFNVDYLHMFWPTNAGIWPSSLTAAESFRNSRVPAFVHAGFSEN